MSTQNSQARKRLALEDPMPKSGKEVEAKKDKQLLKKAGKNDIRNVQIFKPRYDKPNTRASNGIQVPKHSIYDESGNDNGKGAKITKVEKRIKAGNIGRNAHAMGQFGLDGGSNSLSKSNNNATTLVNPDPSKYVLTNWGDASILGKRKVINTNDDVDEEMPLDDGIQVMVDTDVDDLDYEDDIEMIAHNVNSSSDDDVVLGDTAATTSAKHDSKQSEVGKDKSKKSKDDTTQPKAGTSSEMTAEELKLLQENPRVHSILNKLLDHRLKDILPQTSGNAGKVSKKVVSIPNNNEVTVHKQSVVHGAIKSPSDTMIYVPALKLQNQSGNEANNVFKDSNAKHIEEFVGAVRAQVQAEESIESGAGVTAKKGSGVNCNDEARQKAERTIIEAEKFRASIATPPEGNLSINDWIVNLGVNQESEHFRNELSEHNQIMAMPTISLAQGNQQLDTVQHLSGPPLCQEGIPNIGTGLSDDDFFHLTCFIEPSLIHKIERGEFVELEKLLPKDRNSYSRGSTDENRLEWVQRDGGTFLVSAGRDQKITGIRRWEQAFRVYATIYCAANPQRAKEIWQYISNKYCCQCLSLG